MILKMNKMVRPSRLALLAILFVIYLLSVSSATAQPTIKLGFMSQSGNSDTVGLSAEFESKHSNKDGELALNLGTRYQETEGETSGNSSWARIRARTPVTYGWYQFGFGQLKSNRSRGIDYESVLAAGAGYVTQVHITETNYIKLRNEVSPGLISRNYDNEKPESYINIRWFGEVEYEVNETVKFGQSAEYFNRFDNLRDWNITTVSKVVFRVSEQISFSCLLEYNYVHLSPAGYGSYDVYSGIELRWEL
jgi:putative salt-induced outer membrane protein YdiY